MTLATVALLAYSTLAPQVQPGVVEFQVRNPKAPETEFVTICSGVVVDRRHRALVVTGEHYLCMASSASPTGCR